MATTNPPARHVYEVAPHWSTGLPVAARVAATMERPTYTAALGLARMRSADDPLTKFVVTAHRPNCGPMPVAYAMGGQVRTAPGGVLL